MEIESEKKPLLTSDMLQNQIEYSIRYIKEMYRQRDDIKLYLNELLSDQQAISVDTKIQLQVQLKWFKIFFDNYSEEEGLITTDHINLKENIFNQYSNYLKDIRCSFYTIFINDLKHLPDINESINTDLNQKQIYSNLDSNQLFSQNQPICQYDSLKLTIAISHLILYLYYFFINKHNQIYLTNLMFAPEQSLINIASISHIDYIIYIYEMSRQSILYKISLTIIFREFINFIIHTKLLIGYSSNLYEEGEEVDDLFKLEVKNFEYEINQFENFLESLKMISEFDEDLMKYIPKFEYLYGFFLAKQQTIDLCKENNRKMSQFENYYKDVVEMAIVNLSIPNNKLIDNKNFNSFYLHPYISLNHLTFNQFISPTTTVKQNMQNKTDFFDIIYSIIFSQLSKIFQNNCFISNDTQKQHNQSSLGSQSSKHSHNKNNNQSKQSKKSSQQESHQSHQQKVELQKCLNLIQETIIISKKAEQDFSKLTEQIFSNIT